MRFSVATVLAIATAVFAQTDGFDVISNPYVGEKVLAGLPCEIKWAPSSEYQGTVRIDVLGGTTPQTLNKVGTVASGVDSSKGSYKWNVDSHLGTANTYGIQITLESNDKVFQYSFPFHIIGGLVGSDDATTVAVPTTAAAGTAKPLTVAAPATTKAAIATTKASDAAPATTDAATGSASGSASDASASGAVSSFSTVVSANASVQASATSSDVVATASASSTGAAATGGAAAFGASTGALLGGVAMALFAL
ncbi:hypothetical protein N0V85_001722 [Neurospora sp. IMI 360204]|nr:hypothetical protein N0V85_001722 [Neurospora sp. IMI 360204]